MLSTKKKKKKKTLSIKKKRKENTTKKKEKQLMDIIIINFLQKKSIKKIEKEFVELELILVSLTHSRYYDFKQF